MLMFADFDRVDVFNSRERLVAQTCQARTLYAGERDRRLDALSSFYFSALQASVLEDMLSYLLQ